MEAGTGTAKLRIVRFEDVILTLVQPEGGAWTLVSRSERTDFSSVLQVGMAASSDGGSAIGLSPADHNNNPTVGNADLHATFDFMRFDTPRDTDSVSAAELLDPTSMTDADLEALFGDPQD